MTTISSSTGVASQQSQQTSGGDAFEELGVDQFLQMMITEMQNQDPLDPMDTTAILEQVGQLREIAASDQLTETLASVLLGQNLATASGLIGRLIVALTDDAEQISGQVDGISIVDGEPKLTVGQHTVDLANVSQVLAESADTEAGQTTEEGT